MGEARYVTVMLIPDGTESRRGFRIRQWLAKCILGFVAAILIGIILFFAFYGTVLKRAAMTDRLLEENRQLLRYQYKVKMLEENLKQTRDIVTRLVNLAGIDFDFPEIPNDSTIFAHLDRSATIMAERSSFDDMGYPSGLPMQGFISQDFEIEDQQRYHPGIDIAGAVGRPVLATAAGLVVSAEFDSVYGLTVILRHNDSVTTLYGHNDSLLVRPGQRVAAGGRLALSGNTGQSTAPHVHYEMRINDKPVNPLEIRHEKNNQ